MLKRIKDFFYRSYEICTVGTPKERLLPSHNLIIVIIIMQYIMYLAVNCLPLSICATVFLILSLVCYLLFRRGYIRFSTYSLYVLTAWITGCACYYLGWTFGYSLFSFAIIPILYYYIYIMEDLTRSIKIGTIISAVHLICFAVLRLFVYYYGPAYEYPVTIAYTVSIINWITCGFMLIHFCTMFIFDIRNMKLTLEDKNERLTYIALYDSLTGFRNRQSIGDDISKMITAAKENHSDFTMILSDIDDFKTINDSYGHAQGDKVLMRLATVFLEEMPEDALICRWGGEEFLIAMPYDLESAKQYANQIRHRLAQIEFRCQNQPFHVTVTFGVQPLLSPDTPFETLIQEADENLYCGKRRGKDCIAYQNFIWRY